MVDLAYEENRRLESREAEQLRREMLEDRILTDGAEFDRLARMFAREFLTDTAEYKLTGFLPWAVEQLIREEDPAFTEAWMTEQETNELLAGERKLRREENHEKPINK